MIWDRGRWIPEGDPHKGLCQGPSRFRPRRRETARPLASGAACAPRQGERRDNWLLIKGKDEEARSARGKDILEEKPLSAVSGRSIEEIAAGKGKKRVWHSNRAVRQPQRNVRNGEQDRPGKNTCARKVRRREGGEETKRTRIRRERPGRAAAEFRAAEPRHAARRCATRQRMAARDQIRRLSHRGAARSRQSATADPQTTGLDCPLQADRGSGRGASRQNRAAGRRIGRRGRPGRFQFFAVADRSEGRPRATGWSITSSICCISTAAISGRSHCSRARLRWSGCCGVRVKRAASVLPSISMRTAGLSSSMPARWGSKAWCRSCAMRRIGPAGRNISSRASVTIARNSSSPGIVRQATNRARSAR